MKYTTKYIEAVDDQRVYFLWEFGSKEESENMDLLAFFYFQSALLTFCTLLFIPYFLFSLRRGDLEIEFRFFYGFFIFLLLLSR
jgi:hypothetical protein